MAGLQKDKSNTLFTLYLTRCLADLEHGSLSHGRPGQEGKSALHNINHKLKKQYTKQHVECI